MIKLILLYIVEVCNGFFIWYFGTPTISYPGFVICGAIMLATLFHSIKLCQSYSSLIKTKNQLKEGYSRAYKTLWEANVERGSIAFNKEVAPMLELANEKMPNYDYEQSEEDEIFVNSPFILWTWSYCGLLFFVSVKAVRPYSLPLLLVFLLPCGFGLIGGYCNGLRRLKEITCAAKPGLAQLNSWIESHSLNKAEPIKSKRRLFIWEKPRTKERKP